MKKKNSNIKSRLIILICIIMLLVLSIFFIRFEGEKPSIDTQSLKSPLNASKKLSFSAYDNKSGLKKIWICLVKNGKESILYEKKFPAAGLTRKGIVYHKTFEVGIEPEKNGITDGKALVRIVVTDYSWRRWGYGNKTYIEKEIIIDTKPPQIDILTRTHNVARSGTGLIIYRISEPCSNSGVYINDNFFPGHSGYYKDPNILLSFFAIDFKYGSKSKIFVRATDKAGNSATAGFYYHIKNKTFKQDTINISDRFLNCKMPEFETELNFSPEKSMIEKFLAVNGELRKKNFKEISEIVNKTDNVLYWNGPFLRLAGSASRAGFADHRTYKYKGKVIDHQVHLGIDLASVAHSPVTAANKGKVAFAKPLGIYGKTVIIDHGFGLFSMYAHLSSIKVQTGQIVSKGEFIGKTGNTGLAGGDHLHFSMLVNNTFVNPIEWWDEAWIKNNITTKLEQIKITDSN